MLAGAKARSRSDFDIWQTDANGRKRKFKLTVATVSCSAKAAGGVLSEAVCYARHTSP